MCMGHFHWLSVQGAGAQALAVLGTGVASVRRAQGCPESDRDGSSWLQPTHLRALRATVAAPLGKQSCIAVRSEGNV